MKYENKHFYEAPRIFWPTEYSVKFNEKTKRNEYKTGDDDKYKKYHHLSVYAKWLYQTMKELEHRYTGKENAADTVIFDGVDNKHNWFYCGMDKLMYMSGLPESTARKARKELIDAGLISTCKCWFTNNGKKTSQWVTAYRVYGESEITINEIM